MLHMESYFKNKSQVKSKKVLTKSAVLSWGHGRVCEATGRRPFGRGGVDVCHFLVKERKSYQRKHMCLFFTTGTWKGDAAGHQNQLAMPKSPVHTLTWTHTHTHTLKNKGRRILPHIAHMKNDMSAATQASDSTEKLCCCRLVCTHI